MTSTLKPIVILQARCNSRRLPGKVLKKINNIPIIILCVKRLANKGHKVIVATSEKKSDDRLVRVLRKNSIKYFRGKLNDVYSRYVNIIKINNLKEDMLIVRATGDNILPDGNLINLLTKKIKNKKSDYLKIDTRKHHLPKGFTLEIFKVSELLKLNKVKLSKHHLEHVTLKIYENKRKYKNILIKEIRQKKNLTHFRVTIDKKKDYIFMKNLFKKVKNPYKESSLKILNYLKKE
tara:strand:- start:414 stop:1118 length:705 start_codon:yes stop_codon:yes gene_type:complete